MTQIKMADLHTYFTYLDGHLFWNLSISRNKATDSQNMANRSYTSRSKSKIKGVRKVGNKWRADICYQQNDNYLGSYTTKEEAEKAYNQAAIYYFGEFAK